MVLLCVKKNEESLFMVNSVVSNSVLDVLQDIVYIQDGRTQLHQLCYELEMLSEHGPSLPVDMHGLTDEQISELHLVDKWAEENQQIRNGVQNKDVCNKRNGYPPSERNKETIKKSIATVRAMISGDKVEHGEVISCETIDEAFDILRGTVMIVYPMDLPPYDPIRTCIETSSQNGSKEGVDIDDAELWFAGKKLICDKKLSNYFGNNEKSKVVVKLQKQGSGAPTREPAITEKESRALMLAEFKRREALKKLMDDDDDSYFNSNWADTGSMKKSFHGLTTIKWKP